MTQDEIIKLADKADAEADNILNMKGEYHPNWYQVRDEIFARLVERRKCQELADKIQLLPFGDTASSFAAWVRSEA